MDILRIPVSVITDRQAGTKYFIASKTGQDILGGTGAYFPGYLESVPSFIEYYKGLGIDATPFVEMTKGKTVPAPVAKNYNEWYQIWVKYTSLMLSGEMDPKATLDKIQQEGDVAANQ